MGPQIVTSTPFWEQGDDPAAPAQEPEEGHL